MNPAGGTFGGARSVLSRRFSAAFEARADAEILCTLVRGKLDRSLTGRQLAAEVEARASQLEAYRGTTLVLALSPGATFITTLLGCIAAGITAVPVSTPRRGTSSERLVHIVKDAGAAAILCPAGRDDAVREELGTGHAPVIALPDDPAGALPATASGGRSRPEAAIIQYTSGSTQNPKGVLIGGDNILANCDLMVRTLGMDDRCRCVNWMPHFHDMGLLGGILYPMLCGGMSVQMSPYDFIREPFIWLKAVSDWKANFSGGPAFAYADVLKRISRERLEGLDLSGWDLAFCGAEPVPPGLLEKVAAHLAPAGLRRKALFAAYGMAEITLYAAGFTEPDDDAVQAAGPSHASKMNPELRSLIEIVDPATSTALPEGTEGEICIRGPSKGLGYLNLPDQTEEVFQLKLPDCQDRYLRTGDLGRLEGGRLFISGRLKDVLFSHGRKISAAEVEWLACSNVAMLNPLGAAAFMEDDLVSGRAVLIAETTDAKTLLPDPDAVRKSMRRAVLGEWGLDLVDILFVPRGRLPRTTSGKIRRAQVAAAFRSGAFPPADEPVAG